MATNLTKQGHKIKFAPRLLRKIVNLDTSTIDHQSQQSSIKPLQSIMTQASITRKLQTLIIHIQKVHLNP